MKCITLWQPYASLVAIGAKRIETRSWSTNYTGPLLIHASKKWTDEIAADCKRSKEILDAHGFKCGGAHSLIMQLPWGATLGKILCKCNLHGVRPMPAPPEGTLDRHFGTFGEGRYGWLLDQIVPTFPPVSIVGHQGLFDVDDSVFGDVYFAKRIEDEQAANHA